MPEPEEEYEDEPRTLATKSVLFALAGAFILTAVLAVYVRTRKPSQTASSAGIVEGDWKASLEHLAAAFDTRCQGLDTRFEQLAEQVLMMGASPMGAPAVPAAVSLPVEQMQDIDPDLMQPPPPPQVGALEPPPPGPAAVSMNS